MFSDFVERFAPCPPPDLNAMFSDLVERFAFTVSTSRS